jgi:hypothetical protein
MGSRHLLVVADLPGRVTMAAEAIPSITEPAVDRYRKWSPRWFPWIQKLLNDIIATKAATEDALLKIEQTNEVIDGVAARWGVQILSNSNPPVVVGLIQLDGDAAGSTFKVTADKFIVALPTNVNQSIQAFVAGLVDGVSTVGINGNLVVDDTIKARHLDVTSLSAVSANLGAVRAGTLESPDSVIATGKRLFIDLNNPEIILETV